MKVRGGVFQPAGRAAGGIAGTAPDAAFGASTVTGMRADGFAALEGQPPKVAEQVVTFGLQLPAGLPAALRVDRNCTPSPGANYGAARHDIRDLVEELLVKLSGQL